MFARSNNPNGGDHEFQAKPERSFCIFLSRKLVPERVAASQAKGYPRASVSEKEEVHAAETSLHTTMIG